MSNSRFKKGHIMTKETREKISKKLRGFKRPQETIEKMRKAQKGRIVSKETGEKIRQRMLGTKASEETRKKMSLAQSGDRGNKWKGGITPVLLQIRHHFKMRQWISDCFTRDDYTCQDCGKRGGKLVVHHIKYFSKIIEENGIKSIEDALICEELWNINNGETRCCECHKKIHLKKK